MQGSYHYNCLELRSATKSCRNCSSKEHWTPACPDRVIDPVQVRAIKRSRPRRKRS